MAKLKHDKSFKHYIPYIQHYFSTKIKRNVFLSGLNAQQTNHVCARCAPPYSIPSDKAKRLLCFTSFIRFSIDVPDDPPVGNPLLHFNRNNCLCCICSDYASYIHLHFNFPNYLFILSGLSYNVVSVQCLIYLYRSRVEDETIKSTNSTSKIINE